MSGKRIEFFDEFITETHVEYYRPIMEKMYADYSKMSLQIADKVGLPTTVDYGLSHEEISEKFIESRMSTETFLFDLFRFFIAIKMTGTDDLKYDDVTSICSRVRTYVSVKIESENDIDIDLELIKLINIDSSVLPEEYRKSVISGAQVRNIENMLDELMESDPFTGEDFESVIGYSNMMALELKTKLSDTGNGDLIDLAIASVSIAHRVVRTPMNNMEFNSTYGHSVLEDFTNEELYKLWGTAKLIWSVTNSIKANSEAIVEGGTVLAVDMKKMAKFNEHDSIYTFDKE